MGSASGQQGIFCMVLHIQPAPNVPTVAIEQHGLFGEPPRAVIVVLGVHQVIALAALLAEKGLRGS